MVGEHLLVRHQQEHKNGCQQERGNTSGNRVFYFKRDAVYNRRATPSTETTTNPIPTHRVSPLKILARKEVLVFSATVGVGSNGTGEGCSWIGVAEGRKVGARVGGGLICSISST